MAEARNWVEYRRDAVRPLEAMHAHFHDHVYALHSHDTYSFGITEEGAQRFRCRGADHTSAAGMVMAFNPDEVHDGRAAAELGYHYRIVHIGPSVVSDVLDDAADGRSRALPLFVRPVFTDQLLPGLLARLHATVLHATPSRPGSELAREELLTAAVLAMAQRGATRDPRLRTLAGGAQRRAAHRARALLDEAPAGPVSAQQLALAAGCSRFALYRAFRAEYGMAPSDYQRLLRLRRARGLLAGGVPPAEAAAAAGFADQAHFNRWFKRAYGITPGHYQRSAG